MADTYKRVARTSSSAAGATTVYTVPGATTALVKKIHLSNNSGVSGTVKLHHVESGGSADGTNVILPTVTLGNNEQAIDDGPFVMETGDTLQILADGTNAITINVYAAEVV